MEALPLTLEGHCIEPDEILYRNMDHALARGLPVVKEALPATDQPIALVGSGPSISDHLDAIDSFPGPVVAIKGAHDYLIQHGIFPDAAVAIDPQKQRAGIFGPNPEPCRYLISSQCHPDLLDNLKGRDVMLWTPYIAKGQTRPKNSMLIGGGTTSGLRAISLYYVLGYRNFHLFGFDSSLSSAGALRVDQGGLREGEAVIDVRLSQEGEVFHTNASMALQVQDFQTYWDYLPDATFTAHGHGLLQAVVRQYYRQAEEIAQAKATCEPPVPGVSFIHQGPETMASYRYRAENPAQWIGAKLNDFDREVLVFSKPQAQDLMKIGIAKARGQFVVVDICDDHFKWPHYKEALRLADRIVCSTDVLRERIENLGYTATVIADSWDYPAARAHCHGDRVLWFGHAVNRPSLERVRGSIDNLRVVSNFPGAERWDRAGMKDHFAWADIVILPATEPHKSANRAIDATRQGCFVVAEPHPALEDFGGIWIGDIKEGVEWASKNPDMARRWTEAAQLRIEHKYSPQILGDAWRKATVPPITWVAGKSSGQDGLASTSSVPRTSNVTS